jgi:hypothetical protein
MIEIENLLLKFALTNEGHPLDVVERYVAMTALGVEAGENDSRHSRDIVLTRLAANVGSLGDLSETVQTLLATLHLLRLRPQLQQQARLLKELERFQKAAPTNEFGARLELQRVAAALSKLGQTVG